MAINQKTDIMRYTVAGVVALDATQALVQVQSSGSGQVQNSRSVPVRGAAARGGEGG